jgi:hypothetical protein
MGTWLFLVMLAPVAWIASLLMAAKLFGQPVVLRWVRNTAWQANQLGLGICRRLLAAARALVSVELDEATAKDTIAEDVEDAILHRIMGRITAIDNRVYDLLTRVEALEEKKEPGVNGKAKNKERNLKPGIVRAPGDHSET